MHSLLAALAAALSASAVAQTARELEEDIGNKPAQEVAPLPGYPSADNLIEFYVSPTTANRFFVDSASLSIVGSEIIRYTLVAKSPSGASSVSFEGIRCNSRELRQYAFGRSDGTWSEARASTWKEIRNNSLNRHHAALFSEYFCVGGAPVSTAAEAIDALRRGGHPLFPQPSR